MNDNSLSLILKCFTEIEEEDAFTQAFLSSVKQVVKIKISKFSPKNLVNVVWVYSKLNLYETEK